MIPLAPGLSLPLEIVTSTLGILGVRGSGKSNTAAVLVEGLAEAGLPFGVIDPVGAWWGLRASRDGKGRGLEVPIFGGLHGDFPLGAGEELADVLAEMALSCVVDVSELTEGEKKRWLTAFAARLYRQKSKAPSPYHLILEEADDYAPQRPMGRDEPMLLRAWENIVRRGRMRGLGITMITQRSASLNKNLLTQIETLVAMRTTGPQDRKAILAWVDYHGQGRELVDSLPALAPGEGWVWSPQFLGRMERAQFPRRRTFDSGATPKAMKGKRAPVTLAEIDAPALRERLASSIQAAKAEDPRELKREIGELRKKVRELEARPPEAPEKVVERVEVPVLSSKDRELLKAICAKLEKSEEHFGEAANHTSEIARLLVSSGEKIAEFKGLLGQLQNPAYNISAQNAPPPPPKPAKPMAAPAAPRRDVPIHDGAEGLRPRMLEILRALAELEALGRGSPPLAQVAVYVGLAAGSGNFNNLLGRLSTLGLIERIQGRVSLTPEGRKLAGPIDVPLDHAALMSRWKLKLRPRLYEILSVLAGQGLDWLAVEHLAGAVGLAAGSGNFNNLLGRLSTLGLIERDRGNVRASAMLWPEGLA